MTGPVESGPRSGAPSAKAGTVSAAGRHRALGCLDLGGAALARPADGTDHRGSNDRVAAYRDVCAALGGQSGICDQVSEPVDRAGDGRYVQSFSHDRFLLLGGSPASLAFLTELIISLPPDGGGRNVPMQAWLQVQMHVQPLAGHSSSCASPSSTCPTSSTSTAVHRAVIWTSAETSRAAFRPRPASHPDEWGRFRGVEALEGGS